jgi:DNA-cytosine methyltransferase
MGEALGLKILSLFDGISCTQLALKNLDIKVDKYYSSEIDKYAIQITQKNFPDTVQLGDIKDIKGEDLPDIDLIVGGSPCQGFSFAGKQLAFDDPRSALFFEFIRMLKEVKPKYFLLENVRMKKEHMDVISQQVSEVYPECSNGSLFGIEPIKINSALVSAQNRNRLYWTNIPNIEQPEDVGLVLRDVLEDFLGKEHNDELNKMTTSDDKAFVLTASYQGAVAWNSIERRQRTMIPTYNTPKQVGTTADLKGFDIIKRVYSENGKSPTLTTMGGGHREPKVAVTSYKEVRTKEAKEERKRIRKETGKDHTPFRAKELVPREDGKVGTLTPSLNKDHTISVKSMTEVRTPEANKIRREHIKETGKDWSPRHMRHLVERKDDKSNTITANTSKQHTIQIDQEKELTWRKLTPLECERLQTVPDNYTDGVSNTQRYKMLGNGMTVKVIEHILKNMEKP